MGCHAVVWRLSRGMRGGPYGIRVDFEEVDVAQLSTDARRYGLQSRLEFNSAFGEGRSPVILNVVSCFVTPSARSDEKFHYQGHDISDGYWFIPDCASWCLRSRCPQPRSSCSAAKCWAQLRGHLLPATSYLLRQPISLTRKTMRTGSCLAASRACDTRAFQASLGA